MTLVKRFLAEEKGLESVEYAVILGLIVVALIGLVALIGTWVYGRFLALPH
jgi:pilus assembly protein Flp/PilA